MVVPITKRIQTGDYVMGKDARGREWAGFFERLDHGHAQSAFVWVHIGRGIAQQRPLLTDTIEQRAVHAPCMRTNYWRPGPGGIVELRTHRIEMEHIL